MEKLIPLGRLTCIIMPHHGSHSTLRPRETETVTTVEAVRKEASFASEMRSWTAIKMLKYRKKDWLFDLLQKEGDTL